MIEPISNIQQAKEFYKSMGCSHFHMGREFPERYEEYELLKVSKEMETEWKLEQFYQYFQDAMENKTKTPLWIIHSRMEELVQSLKTDVTLKKMLEVTQCISDKVPFYDRVIVSETINGRKDRRYRSGLVYLAYDLNEIPTARAFIELSLHFANFEQNKSREFERCQRTTKLCYDIKDELGL